MAAVKGRSRRNTREAVVFMQGRVPPEVRAMAGDAADDLGISLSQYLDALVRADAAERFVRPSEPYRQEQLPA